MRRWISAAAGLIDMRLGHISLLLEVHRAQIFAYAGVRRIRQTEVTRGHFDLRQGLTDCHPRSIPNLFKGFSRVRDRLLP